MGVKASDTVHTPQSTGAVSTPTEPVTTEQPADAASTGAVAYVPPGETSVDYHGDAVVRSEPPSGPVTMTVGWLPDYPAATKAPAPEAKVVRPPAAKRPTGSRRQVTTKKQ